MSEIIPSTEQRLGAYLACESAILTGHQSHTVEGVTYTRANLRDVQIKIEQLRSELDQRNQPVQRIEVVML